MSAALDALTAQVTANASAEASAVTLIQGLAEELKAALAAHPDDSAALTDLANKLQTSANALGAAVVANTPAAAAAPHSADVPASAPASG